MVRRKESIKVPIHHEQQRDQDSPAQEATGEPEATVQGSESRRSLPCRELNGIRGGGGRGSGCRPPFLFTSLGGTGLGSGQLLQKGD